MIKLYHPLAVQTIHFSSSVGSVPLNEFVDKKTIEY